MITLSYSREALYSEFRREYGYSNLVLTQNIRHLETVLLRLVNETVSTSWIVSLNELATRTVELSKLMALVTPEYITWIEANLGKVLVVRVCPGAVIEVSSVRKVS